MAIDKVVDSAQLDAAMTATANAIRTQGGTTAQIQWKQSNGFADAIGMLSNIKLASIEIVTPPAKTLYSAGDAFNDAGTVLKATYSNGATRTLTSGWTTEGQYGPSTDLDIGTSFVTYSLTEGGATKSVNQPIEISNPIVISSAIEINRVADAGRTLRAAKCYNGRFLLVETTEAEQVFHFSFDKNTPATVAGGYMAANRPYPVADIAMDGTYVWFGITTKRATAPYGNRYILRAPYSSVISGGSYSLNYWNSAGASVEAISEPDATNGYFTIVGEINGLAAMGSLIPSNGAARYLTYSDSVPLVDVCAFQDGVAAISTNDERVAYAENTVAYTVKWGSAGMPPIKIAADALNDGLILTSETVTGENAYSFRRFGINSGGTVDAYGWAPTAVAELTSEIIGFESLGDYFVLVSKGTDGVTTLTAAKPQGGYVLFQNFELDVENPVGMCKDDDGYVIVFGQSNGKYTMTALSA